MWQTPPSSPVRPLPTRAPTTNNIITSAPKEMTNPTQAPGREFSLEPRSPLKWAGDKIVTLFRRPSALALFGPTAPPPHTLKQTPLAIIVVDAEGKRVNQYLFVRTLGKGSYSKVKLALNTDTEQGEFYALKICSKKVLARKRRGQASALDSVLQEIELLRWVNHRNIITLYEVINDPHQESLYMGLDFFGSREILVNG
eukprot:TRINITY_DN3812_c0_g1_i5.p1 TRINITY_DN3812_c0_g1~~TRINITY_DN3812_c0_g1_i5.p1  ORF type:complete len:199 (-),score=34.32 TRINITY_DN3812_c0_g1_i5:479-1075(-)